MNRQSYSIAATFLFILLSSIASAQTIDENYIKEQIGLVNEYTLLTYGLGPAPAPKDSLEKWKIGHLTLLFQLQVEGKISFFGPVSKDPSNVGIAIFNTNDETVVKRYMERDPFVTNKVLTYKLAKWYAVPDRKLLPSTMTNK
jgi:uncharacterized protein YciI